MTNNTLSTTVTPANGEYLNGFECFDGKLRETYAKQGFVTVARSPFNREYAPETWNYDVEGEPDYLVMNLPGSPTHKHYTNN